jgi:hypothetical protein
VEVHLRVERSLLWQPSPMLSFDCLRGRDGQVLLLPGTTGWFPHLQQAVEQHRAQPPVGHKMQLQGGIVLAYTGLGLALIFLLADSRFGPRIPTATYAWAATATSLLTLLLLTLVTGRWCRHYARVNAEILPGPRFVVGTGLLGVLLLLVGVCGRRILFPFGPLPIAWGSVFLFCVAACARRTVPSRPRQTAARARPRQIAARAVQLASLVVGALLVLYTFVPALTRLQDFTYAVALYKLGAERPYDRTRHDRLFQELCSVVDWMPRWDPIYSGGSYYQGVCEYFRGHYAASLAAYQKAVAQNPWPDLHHCRALTYFALGDQARAQQDLQVFMAECPGCLEPVCLMYFPDSRQFWDPGNP